LAISANTVSGRFFFGKGQAMMDEKHVVRIAGPQGRTAATMGTDETGSGILILYDDEEQILAAVMARPEDGGLLVRVAGAGDKWRVEIRHGPRGGRVLVDNPAGDFKASLPLANRPLTAAGA